MEESTRVHRERVEHLMQRCHDLESQNTILLDRFEQEASFHHPPTTDTSAPHNQLQSTAAPLTQVVLHLRQELKVQQFEYAALQQENARQLHQLHQLQISVTRLQSESLEHPEIGEGMIVVAERVLREGDECRKRLEVILESNDTLRRERSDALEKVQRLSRESKNLRLELEPMSDRLDAVTCELEARVKECALLKEDGERWQERSIHLMAKYNVCLFLYFYLNFSLLLIFIFLFLTFLFLICFLLIRTISHDL